MERNESAGVGYRAVAGRLRAQLNAAFGIDLRSLALFRVSLAFLIFAELCDRAAVFRAHYTESGVVPAGALRQLTGVPLSLFQLSDGSGYAAALFVLAATATLLLVVGWHTRLASIALFVLIWSIQARNPLINHNGDVLMRLALMWGLFLPLGGAFSLDARRAGGSPAASCVCSPASAGLLLQGMFLYWVTGASKLQYDIWWRGDALFAVLQKDAYARPLGELLLNHPDLVTLLSHAALLVEALVPILLFWPWQRHCTRTLAVLLAAGLQLGIFCVIKIGTFQPLAVLVLFPFLPAWFWERFTRLRLPEAPAALPGGPAPRWRRPAGAAAALSAGLLLVLSVALNLASLRREPVSLPGPIASVARALGLEQRWRMFANAGTTLQGWHVAVGHLHDGRRVDLLRGGFEPSLAKPERYSSLLPNNGWRMYWTKIAKDKTAPFRPYLGRYLCNEWNSAMDADLRVAEVEVIFVQKFAYDPASQPRFAPRPLLRLACS